MSILYKLIFHNTELQTFYYKLNPFNTSGKFREYYRGEDITYINTIL